MIFHSSKLIALSTYLLFLLLLACSQPPNYAPVKTVNQAFEPDNGYVSNTPPKVNPNIQGNPQPSPTPPQNKQEMPQKSNIENSAQPKSSQYQIIQQSTTQPNTAGNPPKSKPTGTLTTQSPKLTKIANLAQDSLDKSLNKSIGSNANVKNTQKNLHNNEKSLDNFRITEKNNKKSIISIDNKEVLKLNFQWPLQGRISKNFNQTGNKGILIAGKTGQAVRAAESGKAVYCGQGLAGFGNLAIIKHNESFLSAYANNSKLYIKEGQQVEKGQTIGQVGLTGLKRSSLHFEIRKNGKPINPLTVLPRH
jgi:lipoprotein NlpD